MIELHKRILATACVDADLTLYQLTVIATALNKIDDKLEIKSFERKCFSIVRERKRERKI